MTVDEVRDVFRLVLAAYPTQRQRMSDEDARTMAFAYRAGLEDLDAIATRAAVIRLVRTSRYIPTIAEIREAVGVIAHGACRTGLEAWDEVRRKIGSKGRDRIPGADFAFEDPITAAIVSPVVWRDICQSENIVADRARFVEAYEAALARERVQAQASHGAVSKTLPAVAQALVEGVAKSLGGGGR